MMRSSCVLLISRALAEARSRTVRYIVFPEGFVPVATGRTAAPAAFQNPDCRYRPAPNVLEQGRPIRLSYQEKSMLYAILAYHVEAEVMSWTPEEDAALMTNLLRVHD